MVEFIKNLFDSKNLCNFGLTVIQPNLFSLKSLSSTAIANLWLEVLVTPLRVKYSVILFNQCNIKRSSKKSTKIEIG